MNRYLLISLALISCGLTAQAASHRLEGCSDPGVIASGLEKLRDADWRNVTPNRIVEMWPKPTIRPIECEKQICSVWIRQGRIINAEIECEDVFNFDTDSPKDVAAKQHLYSVTIHYTAETRSEIISIAKLFAVAAGLPADKANSIRNTEIQYFQWNGTDSTNAIWTLDVEFTRLGSRWYVFLGYKH